MDVSSIWQAAWDTSSYGVLLMGDTPPFEMIRMNQPMAAMLESPVESDSTSCAHQPSQMMLCLPPQDRALFAAQAREALQSGTAQGGEWTVQCPSGREKRLMGWLAPGTDAGGEHCLQLMAVEVTARHQQTQQITQSGLFSALSKTYDMVLECDYQRRSVQCIFSRANQSGFPEAGVSLHLEDASAYLLNRMVAPADRGRMKQWMAQITPFGDAPAALAEEFHIHAPDGDPVPWLGVMVPARRGVYWLCLRRQGMEQACDDLARENAMLRLMNEQMQKVVNHFTNGVLAFELQGDQVRPLYVSEGIASFFGYTRDEWLDQMRTFQPVRDFVRRSHLHFDAFQSFLDKGEGAFDYHDPATGVRRIMRAVRMMDTSGDGSHGCIILYDVTNQGGAAPEAAVAAFASRVFIRTFGYFDVFVGGKPMAFRNEKAKELLALLVDRRGGWVTSTQAISYLWEDEPANSVILARYRKVALRLKNALEEYGIESTVETVDGKRRIVMERVRCDLYDHLAGRDGGNHPFSGSYMTNYSWGETTLSALLGEPVDGDAPERA